MSTFKHECDDRIFTLPDTPEYRFLAHHGACEEALEWLDGRPLAEAWTVCERADHMLWLAGKCVREDGDEMHRLVVRAKAARARTVLVLLPEGELAPLRAIEASEAWAADPTDERRLAADAAARAAAAAWWAAWWAAGEAAWRAAGEAAWLPGLVREIIPWRMIGEAIDAHARAG